MTAGSLWPVGEPPAPIIALIGSYTPGRIDGAMREGMHADLLKPITSAGVYGALPIASRAFEARRGGCSTVADLTARVLRRASCFMRDGLSKDGANLALRIASPCRPKLQICLVGLFSSRGSPW